MGVSRNLSVKGNLVTLGESASSGGPLHGGSFGCGITAPRDATENQVNIPGPGWRAVGNLKANTETGDVAGDRERDSPSLLNGANRPGEFALRSEPGNLRLESMPFFGVFAVSLSLPLKSRWLGANALSFGPTVPNPHQVSKMSSLWRIEQSSVREFGKPDS